MSRWILIYHFVVLCFPVPCVIPHAYCLKLPLGSRKCCWDSEASFHFSMENQTAEFLYHCSWQCLEFFAVQMSGLLQPSSAQNWLSSQGSSSGLIVKRTIRVDIPVDKYPNVWIISFPCIHFALVYVCCLILHQSCCSTTLLGASLALGETHLSEWKQVLSAVF